MSSDSELCPSPLPSPIFARCSPARGTVAKKCREFYLKRLERTAIMQKRWSMCDVPQESLQDPTPGEESPEKEEQPSMPIDVHQQAIDAHQQAIDAPPTEAEDAEEASRTDLSKDSEVKLESFPLRKCRSSFDLAMDSLRKEISSLIAQDNDLFRQLLSLHDSIAELRERQRHSLLCMDDDEEYIDLEDTRDRGSNSPSLESLSDPGEIQEISPESTLSSRSSLSATSTDYKPHYSSRCHNHRNRYRKSGNNCSEGNNCLKQQQRKRPTSTPNSDSRPLVFIDKSEICFRCRKMAPPYRRSSSITSLYYLHEDMESYDSGIHLQGSHSDSDHEIFV